MVSTFESLFKYGLRDFSGLAIGKLWNDKTYSVVHLDFSEIKDFSDDHDFARRFEDLLIREFKPAGFVYHESEGLLTGQISSWLSSLPCASLVLLIDEYDAPLTVCLDNETLFEKIRSNMSSFFQTIKSKEGCLRFFFMTGITQCRHNCFPEFNFLDDISLNPIFSSLLGFTVDEILSYFAHHLQNAAQDLKTTENDILAKLSENYGGFSFEPSAQSHIYCPWSVLNFFKYPSLGYQNYWYASGGQPTILLKYLRSHDMVNPESFVSVASITLDELGAVRHINKLSAKALLVQAGYLTIREQLNDTEVVIGYPNKEVKLALPQMYADVMLNSGLAPTIMN